MWLVFIYLFFCIRLNLVFIGKFVVFADIYALDLLAWVYNCTVISFTYFYLILFDFAHPNFINAVSIGHKAYVFMVFVANSL